MATVLVALTRAVIDAAQAVGLDGDELRAAAGAPLDDLDARIPLEAHARVWEAIAAHGEDVGLAIGQRIGLRALGVVGYAMQRADTVADAVMCLQRFRPVILEDAVPVLAIADGRATFRNMLPPRFARLRHPGEAQLAGTLAILRKLAGEVSPIRIAFQHERPRSIAAHEAVFRCPIEFAMPATEIVVDASVFMRRLDAADADLHDYLVARASGLLADVGESTWCARVRRAIAARLPSGEPSLDEIAHELETSGRTLHRRLAEEQATFADLLDTTRRDRAFVLLRDRELAGYEIARLLGYTEHAAFTRAFRRWTDETPEAWRARQR